MNENIGSYVDYYKEPNWDLPPGGTTTMLPIIVVPKIIAILYIHVCTENAIKFELQG